MSVRWIAIAAVAMLATGCETFSKGPLAAADVKGFEGSKVWGRVTFHQPEGDKAGDSGSKVYIRADINGLPPGQSFGFHVHEKGDCSNNGMGAGGHFNPAGKPHGRSDGPEHHAGDLPNLQANGEGVAVYAVTSDTLTVAPGPKSVINRAVVIHAQPDDYKTQPAGNSGARIACGVIRSWD